MRGFDNDFFRGHFGPHFGGMGGPPSCPFRGEFPGHHGRRPGFGPFGGFDHSPERHGDNQHEPEHHRRGPEGGRHGCGHHGTSDNDCDGARGHLGPRGGRGPGPCFGRRPQKEVHQEHGPEQNKRGPKDGHCGRKCDHHDSDSDSDGPADRHCRGLPGFRRRGGRRHGSHGFGPSCHRPRPCFGQCGPFDFPHGPFRGPWEGPWGFDRPRFGRHGPHQWFSQRPCPYNNEERPPRKSCEKCRDNEPCCSGNKENRGRGKGRKENGPCCDKGRKENGPCFDKDKDQNLSDTVFVQRIVLEKATRPQSV